MHSLTAYNSSDNIFPPYFFSSALEDFKLLEEELMLVGSHFVKKSGEVKLKRDRKKCFTEDDFDANQYGSRMVDR